MVASDLTFPISFYIGKSPVRRRIMSRFVLSVVAVMLLLTQHGFSQSTAPTTAQTTTPTATPSEAQALYDRVTPSLVAVQYTLEAERGRQEIIVAGVVVGDDGLVAMT